MPYVSVKSSILNEFCFKLILPRHIVNIYDSFEYVQLVCKTVTKVVFVSRIKPSLPQAFVTEYNGFMILVHHTQEKKSIIAFKE